MKAKTFLAIAFLLSVLSVLNAGCRHSEQQSLFQDYRSTRDLQKFIKWRQRLQEPLPEKEKRKLRFAIAEYYFRVKATRDAERAFSEYLHQKPADISTLLANVYLYKLAQTENSSEENESLKKEIFKSKFVLLFDEYKTLEYVSLNGNRYAVRYFVDKIEIFLNGDLFEQVNP